MSKKVLGKDLRRMIAATGYTPAEIASLMGKSVSTLTRYMNISNAESSYNGVPTKFMREFNVLVAASTSRQPKQPAKVVNASSVKVKINLGQLTAGLNLSDTEACAMMGVSPSSFTQYRSTGVPARTAKRFLTNVIKHL